MNRNIDTPSPAGASALTDVTITDKKTIRDALIRAARDPEFRVQLGTNPEAFQVEYNISDDQLFELRGLQHLVLPIDDPNLVVANYESSLIC